MQRSQFHRQRPDYKETGIELIDEVRKRARTLRMSMRDLDALSRSKRYFQANGWIGKARVNHKALARAIDALGGRLRVEWD